jgi:hypothetical protein
MHHADWSGPGVVARHHRCFAAGFRDLGIPHIDRRPDAVLARKTTRTAESMYDEYADSPRKQRRYAREHGGEWREDQAAQPPAGDDETPRSA